MSGYADRVKVIDFSPELAEKDDNGHPVEKLWIAIRNPKHLTASEITARDVALDSNGMPIDIDEARHANNEMISRLIIAWRVYDATCDIDPETLEPADQRLLPTPPTPELVDRLPVSIVMRLIDEIGAATNPPSPPAPTTSKT